MRRLRLRRNNKKKWELASGHRKKSTAIDRRDYLASRPRRQNQEFKVKKGTDPNYPWEVQYRNK